jgi:uncharacterized protein involved in exopolysaccharide biosynthesis
MTGSNDDVLSFREIFLFFWKRKALVILITFLSAVLAFSYIKIFAKPFYISQSKLVVAEEYNQAKSLSSGALGGLAGIAGGILGGGSEVARGDLALQTVKSKDFLEILIQDNYIYTSIFAASSYNPVTKVLTYDKKLYDSVTNSWVREASPPLKSEPSVYEVQKIYLKNLSITQDRTTSVIEITYKHISPVFANYLINEIINKLNEITREKKYIETQNAIDYLKNKHDESTQLDLKASINSMISGKIQDQMLTKISDEYLLKVVDSPSLPIKKSGPNSLFILIFGTMLGFIISLISVLSSHFYNASKRSK